MSLPGNPTDDEQRHDVVAQLPECPAWCTRHGDPLMTPMMHETDIGVVSVAQAEYYEHETRRILREPEPLIFPPDQNPMTAAEAEQAAYDLLRAVEAVRQP